MKKILYFVRGGIASPDQKKEAAELGAFIRSASVGANDFVERCDAVAGDVPERYKHFPFVGAMEQEAEAPMPLPDVPITYASGGIVTADQVAQQAPQPVDATTHVGEYRIALMGKTVKEQREIAKANGIPLPAEINTKEEIADYVSKALTQS